MSTPAPTSAVLCGPWATPGDVPAKVKTDTGLTDDAQWIRPLQLASEILWMLTGRRWLGEGCEETVTVRSVAQGQGTWPYSRTWGECPCWGFGSWSGNWLYPPIEYVGNHIRRPIAIRLPRSEAQAVTSVTIGGVAFTDFELAANGWLRRTDGQGWPVCGDETVITYRFGTPPPMGGVQACVTLGTEIARDMYGLDDCQLPQRVTSISREGVTMTVIDPMQFLDKGHTGLISVDLWITAINPKPRAQRAMIWSPDIPTAQR